MMAGSNTARPAVRRADAVRNRDAILAAADEAFRELGVRASTGEVARRAGVAVGTVFRHFPTKVDLLTAVLRRVLARLRERADTLHRERQETGLFEFVRELVGEAAAHKTVLTLFHDAGGVPLSRGVEALADAVGALVEDAHRAGSLRTEIGYEEVMALLVALSEGAERAGWDDAMRDRLLAIVFTGLRPPP